MKKIIIFLLLTVFMAYGCDNKTQNKKSLLEMGVGVDESGYVITPEIYLYAPEGFFDNTFDFKTEYPGFASVNQTVNIEGKCSGNYSNVDFINTNTGFTLKRDITKNKVDCDIKGMPLIEGDNVIEGIITNDKGYSKINRIIVTYNTTVDFTGSLKLSDNAAGEDKPEDIVVTIPISSFGAPDENGVRLFLEENGERKYIATLKDSGEKGGVSGEDFIYKGQFNTAGMKEGRYRLRALATAKGKENYTAPVYMIIYTANLTKKLKEDSKSAEAIVEKYFQNVDEGKTLTEQINYRKRVAEEIKNTPNLISANVDKDGFLVLSFKHLKYYVIYPASHAEIHKKDGTSENESGLAFDLSNEETKTNVEKYKEFRDILMEKPAKNKKAKVEQNMIWSNNVISLSPFIKEFQDYDSYRIFPSLTASIDPIFPGKAYLNEDADLEKFKHLEKYGIIIIDSHGRVQDGDFLLATGQKVSDEYDEIYNEDLQAGRLAKGHVKLFGFGPEYYLVTSQFLKNYSNDMPNSLVYISACYSSVEDNGYNELGVIFDYRNAGAFIGYDNKVFSSYTSQIGTSLFRNLLEGSTVKESLEAAKKDAGWVVNAVNSANIILKGNENLKIADRNLKNGGFEEDSEYWQTLNAIINESDYLPPASEGSKRIIMSSEVGYVLQTIKIPENASGIAFQYLGLAQGSISDKGWICNGKFEVTLKTADDNETVLGGYDFINIPGNGRRLTKDDPYITKEYSEQDVWYATDWLKAEYPVSSFAGKIVTLKFNNNYTFYMPVGELCISEIQIDDVRLY